MNLNQYTVFCQDSNGVGTIWIGVVDAQNVAEAISKGRDYCANDWGYAPEEVHVLGVAEGDVKILAWEDIEQ